MQKGIFITGTGTDVGKTYICGLLVKQLREFGVNCGYYKPVLSGATVQNNELVAGDVQHVLTTAQMAGNSLDFVSYAFEPAVSPHLAAKMNNQEILSSKILTDFNFHVEKNDFTVVEGAGGIICPLNLEKNFFLYDLPQLLSLDVIIVADAGLGTINNTFLTVDFIKRQGLNIKGIILNNYDENNFMHTDNKAVTEKICDVTVIGFVAKNSEKINFTHKSIEALYE